MNTVREGAVAVSGTRGQPVTGPAAEARYSEQPTGLGPGAWTGRALAGTLMIVSGLLSFLTGLAAVTKGHFFTYHANYAFHWNITGWGWTELALGTVVFAAGVCVFLGMLWARMVGVIFAVLSALGSFLFLPYYPFWSMVVIAVDVFMLWALMTSGRHARA
jgi:hypothetical protein